MMVLMLSLWPIQRQPVKPWRITISKTSVYPLKLSPLMMIETYRMPSDHFDYPLHLGVTEAGQ